MGNADLNSPAPLLAHWSIFFRQWLKHPILMASVVPSGQQLARLMVDAIPCGAMRVVELGAGTGAITHALLHGGVDAKNLLVVELNTELHAMLKRRFPRAHVVCGDARHVSQLVTLTRGMASGSVGAVVSSLGMLAIPPSTQRDILTGVLAVLAPSGVLVQYTYGLSSPIDEGVARELGLVVHSAGWAWRNLPPARVFVYSRP